ncbi:MAG: hypothetical protein HY537_17085, partial [Deltaproteobacteria bacterium]|nr:hypothetical protein [Deltaproteobacteria bacterium]
MIKTIILTVLCFGGVSVQAITALPLYYGKGCTGDLTATVLVRDKGEGDLTCKVMRLSTYLWGHAVKINDICLNFDKFASGEYEICHELN